MFDPSRVDRRSALGWIGSAGLVGLVAACGGSSRATKAPSATSTSRAASSTKTPPVGTTACVLTPEATEGPYYIDLHKIRSDITERKPGVPLTLRIAVVGAAGCVPIKNAAVDIWHADAGGVYSGFGARTAPGGPPPGGDPGPGGGQPGARQQPSDHHTFLRGIQLTDANGRCTFHTIYPGWYPGRAVHIHVKVHAGNSVVHTGQLFFPDGLTDVVFRRSPYAARGARDTRNQDDNIYAGAGGAISTLAPRARPGGYVAATTLGVEPT